MKSFDERIAAAKQKADNLIAQQARQRAEEEEACRQAIAATFDKMLEELGEREKARLFSSLEEKATARHRKLIERHPARPTMKGGEDRKPLN